MTFGGADIDRYRVGATLRQVLVAPREINTSQLPDTAQNWQNLNLTYTHGYGIVVAPVNTVDTDGSPLYWIKDIPPHANTAAGAAAKAFPRITRPEIYFGTETNNSVFVDTKAPEFDHPTGDSQVYGSYAGSAGITVGGFLKRLVWISYFDSPVQVGTSDYLTASSRVLLYRNVRGSRLPIGAFLYVRLRSLHGARRQGPFVVDARCLYDQFIVSLQRALRCQRPELHSQFDQGHDRSL